MGFADRRIANCESEQGNDSVVANTAMRGHARGWVLPRSSPGLPQCSLKNSLRAPSEPPRSSLSRSSLRTPSELARGSLRAPSELPRSSPQSSLRSSSELPQSSPSELSSELPSGLPLRASPASLSELPQGSLRAPWGEKSIIFIEIS